MGKYTSEEQIETFLNEDIDAGKADDAILAAEKYIDNITGKDFKASDTVSERKISGNGNQTMVIPECVEITKVEVGEDFYGDSKTEISEGGASGYILLPTEYEDNEIPINEIWLRGRVWTKGLQNCLITAKWGFSIDPPDDIVFVATFLAASIYKQGRSGNIGGVKSERIGEYSISFSAGSDLVDFNKAQIILNSYKSLIY